MPDLTAACYALFDLCPWEARLCLRVARQWWIWEREEVAGRDWVEERDVIFEKRKKRPL